MASITFSRARCLASASLLAVGLSTLPSAAFAQGAKPAGKKPALSPPVLKKFVEAPYPPEAKKSGLEGKVVLQLDIDKTGKVTKAVVINPAGHGFDEAAKKAVMQFEFTPAKRGERAIPSRILYRYNFAQKIEKPPPKDPKGGKLPPAAQPVPVNLSGKVRMGGQDVPLEDAVVVVTDSAGKEVARINVDSQGQWAVKGLPPGKYKVNASAPGYEPIEVEEEVNKGEATEVVYRLPVKGGGFNVIIEGERPPREVTKRKLAQRELSRIPGTNGDALRAIQNLPGVARPPGLAGLLIVRGSAPQDSQFLIDGTFVPLVYHFGGLSSVVPTEMIDELNFYPGNFSSQYGRVMGGIVDVNLRGAKQDKKYHGLAQVDFIDARLMLEGPVPFLDNWSFTVAGRRSYVDVWLKPVLEQTGAGVTSAPVYYDYQVFLETRPTPRSRLRFGLFASDDSLEILIKDPQASDPGVSGNVGLFTGFTRGQVLYTNDITNDLSFRTMLSYGQDKFNLSLGSLYFDNTLQFLTHRAEVSYRLSKGMRINVGQDIVYAPYNINLRLPPPPRPGEPNDAPFGGGRPLQLEEEGSLFQPAMFAEAEIVPNKRARIVPGIRVDYTKRTSRWDVSPRVNGRYNVMHGFPRTTVKGGVGVFYKPPSPQESANVFGSPNLGSNRAIHWSLGMEQEFTKQIELSVEGFYKQLDNVVARTPNDRGGFDYNNNGQGYVVGAETLLRYKPGKRFFGWIAYTLMRSTRRDSPQEKFRLFQYDQTHILTALGSYRLGNGWEFGARWRYVSGPLQTPCRGGIFDTSTSAYACITGGAFSERLPAFHQLDMRVDKRWKFDDWSLGLYLDIWNVYNRGNPEEREYNYNFTQQQYQSGLPIIPSFGIRGEF